MNSFENDSTQKPHNSMTSLPHICGAKGHKSEVFEPWRTLLNDAGPKDHIVQLYQDQQFLNSSCFAASLLHWRTGRV